MKKILMIILLISFILIGCNNNDDNEGDNIQETIALIKAETLETFSNIDYSNFTITSVKNLLYSNGADDYEYELSYDANDGFMVNIIEISKQFSNEKYIVGYPISIIPGGLLPEVVVNLEYLDESITLLLYKGNTDGFKYSTVIFIYEKADEALSIGYENVFPNEIENIFNLLNES